jgi:hypothetical protein
MLLTRAEGTMMAFWINYVSLRSIWVPPISFFPVEATVKMRY